MPDEAQDPLVRELAFELVEDLRAASFRPGQGLKADANALAEIQFTADSPDRAVRVHMDARGLLTDVEFRNGALRRLSDAELARSTMTVIAMAESAVRRALAVVTEEQRTA